MKKLLLIAALALPAFANTRLTLNVIGIDCAMCAKPVANALQSVAGVSKVQVDWKAARATVEVPDNFDRSLLRTALTNAGFDAAFPGEKRKEMEPLAADVVKTLDIVAYPGTSKLVIAKTVVAGKVTIIDFYADWCGPCRVLETRIERLMNADKSIALRRVNIGKWDNAAAKQATELHAEALPYVRVYDAKGNFVAAVTGGMWDEMLAAIDKAKSR
jgi:thiol:disulfide interchange protein